MARRISPRRAARRVPDAPAAATINNSTPSVPAPTLPHATEELPIELIDIAELPRGGKLHLMKCGEDYSIQFGEDELMGTRSFGSEQALATMTCARLGNKDAHVLIGGLGMGYTLGAALAAWSPASTITVVELVQRVADWARGPLSHLFDSHLADGRVSLRIADVHDTIAGERDRYDAILLDVDNGPDGLIQLENDRLYCNWGLRAAHAALRDDGVLAIWSAYPDPEFVGRLKVAGFAVEETQLPAYTGANDDWHSIWFATKIAS